MTENKLADIAFQAQTLIFEESRLLITNRTMESESDHKHFYQYSSTIDQNKSDEVKQSDYLFEH